MNEVEELIHRRRRQVLVHSIIYYKVGDSIISDAQFDLWARELARLQQENVVESNAVEYMREEFADFTGETGFHLPLMDVAAGKIADMLIERKKDG